MVQAKKDSASTKSSKSKSSKSDGGEESLKEYSYTKPAEFEGVYHTCWYSVIRNSATGLGTGTFHVCNNENTPDWIQNVDVGQGRFMINKTDAFGAYQYVSVLNPVEFVGQVASHYQGFAKGDTITLTTYGMGGFAVDDTTNTVDNSTVLAHNDTPDTKVCQKRKGGILECTTTFVDFCSPFSLNDFTAPFCKDRVGQWLNTYTVSSVLATDIANCPTPPGDFCETNPIPEFHPLDRERHLTNDEDVDGSRHPCPVLARMEA